MLTNMESASSAISSGLGAVGKVLTTPFSINDILTRNHAERRLSRTESELELSSVNSRAEDNLVKNFSTTQYKCNLSSSDLSPNTSPSMDSRLDLSLRSAEFRHSFYPTSAMDSNNSGQSGYMSHKFGYFNAAAAVLAAGRSDCPIDMRRCTSNDSGK